MYCRNDCVVQNELLVPVFCMIAKIEDSLFDVYLQIRRDRQTRGQSVL